MATEGQRHYEVNRLISLANMLKTEKYLRPWEGYSSRWRGRLNARGTKEKRPCLQPGECRSHSLLFFISGSVVLHVGARTLLSQACCRVSYKELHNISQHVETDDYRKALQSAWRYVAVWIYLWRGGCCFLSFFLSFCSFMPFPKDISNYFITQFVFMCHSVHYTLVESSASVEAFPLNLVWLSCH
jgi:hypothetical protein